MVMRWAGQIWAPFNLVGRLHWIDSLVAGVFPLSHWNKDKLAPWMMSLAYPKRRRGIHVIFLSSSSSLEFNGRASSLLATIW